MSTTKVSSSKRRRGIQAGIMAALALTALLSLSGAPSPMERTAGAAGLAMSLPPGAPSEDVRYATEWPSPNGDLYNRRVAHSTISSKNVSTLGIAWTIPLTGRSPNGADVANPVIANGIAYLQDGASNVMAVRVATGGVLWTHRYNSPDYGPNGVTIANGKIYGVTATGKLNWYYQAFPDDFHDWDLQISPIYTTAAGHPLVLAAGKGGFVFAFDPASGKLLWKTAVGVHNGHDQDDQLALAGKLHLKTPYTVSPGEAGGVETTMAAAGGAVYVPVVNWPTTYKDPTAFVGTPNLHRAGGEMVAVAVATGKQLWATTLPQMPRGGYAFAMPLGGATVANDLVFTVTFTGEVVALSRKTGAIVWKTRLPAGSNATLAIAGNTLLAGAGLPLTKTEHLAMVAYRLGAKGIASGFLAVRFFRWE